MIASRPFLLPLALSATVILTTSSALAGGFASARFGGERGNPAETNPSTLYYNPAGIGLSEGTQLMLDVHEKGRAVVSSGHREKAEMDVYRLHEHGLWATMQKDGSDEPT